MSSEPLTPRSSSRAEAAEEKRSRILAAATELIAERGFSGSRVVDIARRASVSPGLVIYHFGTLEALLTEALLRSESDFYTTLGAASGVHREPAEELAAVVRSVLGHGVPARQARVLWLETWSQAAHHPAVAEARARQDRRWRQLFTDVAVASGLPVEGARDFAAVFASLLDGLCVQVALGDSEVTSERAVDLALQVLGRYVASPRAEAPPSRDG